MPPPQSTGFSIGLGGTRKPLVGPPKSRKPLSAFDAADDDDDDASSGTEDRGGVFASKSKQQPKKKNTKDISVVNAQLATFNELSKKAERSVAEVDPSIYDYDAVWEDMKSVDRKNKKLDEIDAMERKPKYMESLLASAEVRKRDQLRAKERMLQKEREEEGDEFQDKESFVTSAYKKQQEELRKLEEEERLREESLKKKSQGMTSFHRTMLENMESKHDQLVAAAESRGIAERTLDGLGAEDDDTADAQQLAAEKARQLKESGAMIETNEEGLVVDKTQLLSGGLNITASKKRPVADRPLAGPRSSQQAYHARGGAKQDMRARQSKMLEEQLSQATKRALEAEERSKAEQERQSKSRKTESDVKSAKERYLARKATAAAAAGKEG